MSRIVSALAALAMGAVVCTGNVPAKASAGKENATIERPVATQVAEEFSASRRGRRNTAIALGIAAGLLGGAAIAHGYYYPYPYYGYYGYYGPAYYYGAPVVYVRPRVVRCWVYDPFRGVRYRTYCYR